MNSLRKLEADWLNAAVPEPGAERDEWDVGYNAALVSCAKDIAVKTPAWEEYIEASEALIHAYDLVAAGNFVREFPQIVERQKRALEGVKAK